MYFLLVDRSLGPPFIQPANPSIILFQSFSSDLLPFAGLPFVRSFNNLRSDSSIAKLLPILLALSRPSAIKVWTRRALMFNLFAASFVLIKLPIPVNTNKLKSIRQRE